eukprot:1395427-Heterocapsa_arctica.AAC.1
MTNSSRIRKSVPDLALLHSSPSGCPFRRFQSPKPPPFFPDTELAGPVDANVRLADTPTRRGSVGGDNHGGPRA